MPDVINYSRKLSIGQIKDRFASACLAGCKYLTSQLKYENIVDRLRNEKGKLHEGYICLSQLLYR